MNFPLKMPNLKRLFAQSHLRKADAASAEADRLATALDNPEAVYATPAEVAADSDLSAEEKTRVLEEWVQDLDARLSADNEGMAPTDETRLAADAETKRAATTLLNVLRTAPAA